MKTITLAFSALMLSISGLASANTLADAQAQHLAAQDEAVQKVASLIAESNPEIAGPSVSILSAQVVPTGKK